MDDRDGKKNKKHKKAKHEHTSNGAQQPAADTAGAAPRGADADEEAGPSGRKWTLSIAIPGTLLDNPPSLEFAVCAAAQIARAAAGFQVDEVVVYDDSPAAASHQPGQPLTAATVSTGTALLARLLQFFDTPPHLRPSLHGDFRASPELRLASCLPAPPPPHHARPAGAVWLPYREGVVLKSEAGAGSYVDVGLDRMVWLEQELPAPTRVTVHLGDTEPITRFMAPYSETMIVGKVVPPSAPREALGLYWGYAVRLALGGLRGVFKEAAVSRSGGYDLTIGSSPAGAPTDPGSLVLPSFRHALLVLGGGGGGGAAAAAAAMHVPAAAPWRDLEELVAAVPDWEHKAPQDVFNLFLDTTPHLGTLRPRSEDALPVALAYLITPLLKYGKNT